MEPAHCVPQARRFPRSHLSGDKRDRPELYRIEDPFARCGKVRRLVYLVHSYIRREGFFRKSKVVLLIHGIPPSRRAYPPRISSGPSRRHQFEHPMPAYPAVDVDIERDKHATRRVVEEDLHPGGIMFVVKEGNDLSDEMNGRLIEPAEKSDGPVFVHPSDNPYAEVLFKIL